MVTLPAMTIAVTETKPTRKIPLEVVVKLQYVYQLQMSFLIASILTSKLDAPSGRQIELIFNKSHVRFAIENRATMPKMAVVIASTVDRINPSSCFGFTTYLSVRADEQHIVALSMPRLVEHSN